MQVFPIDISVTVRRRSTFPPRSDFSVFLPALPTQLYVFSRMKGEARRGLSFSYHLCIFSSPFSLVTKNLLLLPRRVVLVGALVHKQAEVLSTKFFPRAGARFLSPVAVSLPLPCRMCRTEEEEGDMAVRRWLVGGGSIGESSTVESTLFAGSAWRGFKGRACCCCCWHLRLLLLLVLLCKGTRIEDGRRQGGAW